MVLAAGFSPVIGLIGFFLVVLLLEYTVYNNGCVTKLTAV